MPNMSSRALAAATMLLTLSQLVMRSASKEGEMKPDQSMSVAEGLARGVTRGLARGSVDTKPQTAGRKSTIAESSVITARNTLEGARWFDVAETSSNMSEGVKGRGSFCRYPITTHFAHTR